MLEEIGLLSALAWYADGFAERSKVEVALELASDLGRLPEDYELSLFRVAQECLANVHRHSGSSTAAVKLMRTSKEIKLQVTDDGKGIDKHLQSKIASGASIGVDFRGMQERVKLMGAITARAGSNCQSSTLPITWNNNAEARARNPSRQNCFPPFLIAELRHWPGLLVSLRPGNRSPRKSLSIDQVNYKFVCHRHRHFKSFAIRRDAN